MLRFLLMIVVLVTFAGSAAAQGHKAKPKLNCRDAKTGQYVTPEYAKKFPGLTVCEQKK